MHLLLIKDQTETKEKRMNSLNLKFRFHLSSILDALALSI